MTALPHAAPDPTFARLWAILRGTRSGRAIAPALLVVVLFVVLPCLWLVWLSAFDESGAVSLENYSRLFTEAANHRAFVQTFTVSLWTVLWCLVLGIPLAIWVSTLSDRGALLMLGLILFPLWTSLLVRAYAWQVLLQRRGLINGWLVESGLVDAPLPLANSVFATVLGMVHIMLPIFLLPTISAMRGIDRSLMRAAASMGASRLTAYVKVFLPLALPGIAAGTVLIFVMCLGFYVTPAILGGGKVQVVAMRIARTLTTYSNFGASAALGVVLLAFTFAALAFGALLRRLLRQSEGATHG